MRGEVVVVSMQVYVNCISVGDDVVMMECMSGDGTTEKSCKSKVKYKT